MNSFSLWFIQLWTGYSPTVFLNFHPFPNWVVKSPRKVIGVLITERVLSSGVQKVSIFSWLLVMSLLLGAWALTRVYALFMYLTVRINKWWEMLLNSTVDLTVKVWTRKSVPRLIRSFDYLIIRFDHSISIHCHDLFKYCKCSDTSLLNCKKIFTLCFSRACVWIWSVCQL